MGLVYLHRVNLVTKSSPLLISSRFFLRKSDTEVILIWESLLSLGFTGFLKATSYRQPRLSEQLRVFLRPYAGVEHK